MTITSYSEAMQSPNYYWVTSNAEQQPGRILEGILDGDQELHGLAAVDDAVIVGQRDVHHGPHHDLAIDHHRAFLGRVHPENSAWRHVDGGRGQQRAECAAVGDGERAAGELLDADLAVARLLRVQPDVLLDVGHALQIGVAQHRNHETALRRNGDTDVVVL